MKKSAVSILHISYWVAYLAIWALAFAALSQSEGITDEDLRFYAGIIVGIAIVPGLCSFYIFYFILFPNYLQKRKIPETIIASILVSLGTFFIAALTLRFTANLTFSCYGESNYIAIPMIAFISLINGIIAYVVRGFITWYDEIKIKEELMQKNHEMEMALVKSQLDPHFLFNTLNNIDILIIKDPKEASDYLNKLSDIMRFMLFETKTEEIPLERELEYITKFIELQKIRTANEHYVNYEVKGCPNNKKVAPMVFIPFIENAFKHSNNKKLKDAINIEIDIEKDHVTMLCENKIDPNRHTKIESNGLGNGLISKRLNLIYPNRHKLNVVSNPTSYRIDLSIDYEQV